MVDAAGTMSLSFRKRWCSPPPPPWHLNIPNSLFFEKQGVVCVVWDNGIRVDTYAGPLQQPTPTVHLFTCIHWTVLNLDYSHFQTWHEHLAISRTANGKPLRERKWILLMRQKIQLVSFLFPGSTNTWEANMGRKPVGAIGPNLHQKHGLSKYPFEQWTLFFRETHYFLSSVSRCFEEPWSRM